MQRLNVIIYINRSESHRTPEKMWIKSPSDHDEQNWRTLSTTVAPSSSWCESGSVITFIASASAQIGWFHLAATTADARLGYIDLILTSSRRDVELGHTTDGK